MNLSKLALLSIISVSIASVSSAASLATKVDPAVTVPGQTSHAKRIRVLTRVKDSKCNDVMDGFGETDKCYTWIKA